MKSKVMYNLSFFLILFAVITNNFCTELPKRFGCHNLSSINKIVDMNSNTNELWRNLEQCMRGTGTYNKKNLDIAKKLQNDFESAEKDTWEEIFYRETTALGYGVSILTLLYCVTTLYMGNSQNKKMHGSFAIAGLLSMPLSLDLDELRWRSAYRRKLGLKESIAKDVKKLVDTLQKK